MILSISETILNQYLHREIKESYDRRVAAGWVLFLFLNPAPTQSHLFLCCLSPCHAHWHLTHTPPLPQALALVAPAQTRDRECCPCCSCLFENSSRAFGTCPCFSKPVSLPRAADICTFEPSASAPLFPSPPPHCRSNNTKSQNLVFYYVFDALYVHDLTSTP